MSYSEAVSECQLQGGILAEPTHPSVLSQLGSMLRNLENPLETFTRNVWLGFTDQYSEGIFVHQTNGTEAKLPWRDGFDFFIFQIWVEI